MSRAVLFNLVQNFAVSVERTLDRQPAGRRKHEDASSSALVVHARAINLKFHHADIVLVNALFVNLFLRHSESLQVLLGQVDTASLDGVFAHVAQNVGELKGNSQ